MFPHHRQRDNHSYPDISVSSDHRHSIADTYMGMVAVVEQKVGYWLAVYSCDFCRLGNMNKSFGR